jgi:hypothetical protein
LEPRPQTSGALTPPLTHASLHACPPPCALPPPHTHFAAHYRRPRPFCSAPTAAIIVDSSVTSPLPLHRTCCRVSPAPSPPLRTRAPPLAYKTPTSSLSSHPKQSTHLIKSPRPNRKQLLFPLPRPKITMLGDSWVEDCCTWFIVFGFLLCMMVILFDRILQWEE